MAQRNTNDGISLIQTSEGALQETSSILSRLRELAVQASTELYKSASQERINIQAEFDGLRDGLDRISASTEFNGLNLSDGSTTSVDVQVGIFNNAANDRISVSLSNTSSVSLGINFSILITAGTSQNAITAIDTAIDSVNSHRASHGASQNQLTSALRNLENYTENLVETESRIRDVDFAEATASMTRNQIFQQAGISVLSQANSNPQAALSLLS